MSHQDNPSYPTQPPNNGSITWSDEVPHGDGTFTIINIIVPYKQGYDIQNSDRLYINKIDYYNINNQVESIIGEFDVWKVTSIENGTRVVISITIPLLENFINALIPTYKLIIKKVATGNNTVLVYNFINKLWETVDNFADKINVKHLVFGVRNGQRRLYAVDTQRGIFLMEELDDGDEFGELTSEPILNNVWLPFMLEDSIYGRKPARGKLRTRAYNFGSIDDKRFSSAEVDIESPGGGKSRISIETENPDVVEVLDRYETSTERQSSRDLPIRKFGSNAKIVVETSGNTPSIRSIYVSAVDPGNNTKPSE